MAGSAIQYPDLVGSRVLLAVAGNIGSGKTTLTARLAEALRYRPLFEPADANPYLSDFYEDMRRYALPLQLRFLALRVAQVRASTGASAILDRTCYEDAEIFARNLHDAGKMDARDYETYQLVAEPLLSDLEPPNLLVYLRREPADCAANVRARGREYEQSMPLPYLEQLGARYDGWFEAYARGPKVLLPASEYDIIERPADLDRILAAVRAALPQPALLY